MTHEEKTFIVEYNSNNSGGGWWLSDEDWAKLETEGWYVAWLGLSFCNTEYRFSNDHGKAPNTCPPKECPGHRGAESFEEAKKSNNRWLGALAREATIEIKAYNKTLAEGVAELWWEEALPNQNAKDQGCNCCGRPHSFYATEKK